MEDITSGRIDIYAELGVSCEASTSEIASKYRQLALKYHPDKNPSEEAAEKFHFFSEVYKVLQDPSLREQYDDIRRHRDQIRAENVTEDVEKEILRFKEQLRKQEQQANKQTKKKFSRSPGVDVLAMRGLNLRRQLQAKLQQRSGYVSYKDLDVPQYTKEFILPNPELMVVWKYRPEENAQIDSESLRSILEIFGPLKKCTITGHDGRYVKGTVVYINRKDAEKALEYDYRSAQLWDGTPVRKLASLLRSVEILETCNYVEAGREHMELNQFIHTISSNVPEMAKI